MLIEFYASQAKSLSMIMKEKEKNKISLLKKKAKISLGHHEKSNKTSNCRVSQTEMVFFFLNFKV